MSVSLIYHTPQTMAGGISPFDTVITDMAEGTDLSIACPYLGLDYLQRIVRLARGWRLLTDVGEWLSAHSPDSRGRIVEFIVGNPDSIRHCTDLHAKVLLAGDRALVGSANLTEKGITGRVEMSVLFEGEAQVDELRDWFERLWEQTGPVAEADLRACAAVIRPPASTNAAALPSKFPGVASRLKALPPAATGGQQTAPEVDELLARQAPAVRQLVCELRKHLEGDGAVVYTTKTNRGDLRHRYTAENPFSVIWCRRSYLTLILRLGEGSVHDPDLVRRRDRPDLGLVRLQAGQPIPDKVIRWIGLAKRYTREHYG